MPPEALWTCLKKLSILPVRTFLVDYSIVVVVVDLIYQLSFPGLVMCMGVSPSKSYLALKRDLRVAKVPREDPTLIPKHS